MWAIFQEETPVAVFKTNVRSSMDASYVLHHLMIEYPDSRVTIDLMDCDKVLRIEGNVVSPDEIKTHLKGFGYRCEELD